MGLAPKWLENVHANATCKTLGALDNEGFTPHHQMLGQRAVTMAGGAKVFLHPILYLSPELNKNEVHGLSALMKDKGFLDGILGETKNQLGGKKDDKPPMTTVFKTLHNAGDGKLEQSDVVLEDVSDYAGIKSRFSETFPQFVRERKIKAVLQALQDELGPSITLTFPRLTHDVLLRLDDEALIERQEKPYLFLAVNNHCPTSA